MGIKIVPHLPYSLDLSPQTEGEPHGQLFWRPWGDEGVLNISTLYDFYGVFMNWPKSCKKWIEVGGSYFEEDLVLYFFEIKKCISWKHLECTL